MKRFAPIDPQVVRELIDFQGRRISPDVARVQAEGAVALFNILSKKPFAYLADEVGMGKTYVSLAVVGLMRFFHPDLRVLYLSPRDNIQRKWIKDHDNFARHNWLHVDGRVKSLQGSACARVSAAESLHDWAAISVRDAHRDLALRMGSFSLGMAKEERGEWQKFAQRLHDISPRVDPEWITSPGMRNRDEMKLRFAAELNTLLPHYDLVIVDEAHNLKHGLQGAMRNLMIARSLGVTLAGDDARGMAKRFDRVLFLSATPLESRFEELAQQLRLFGFAKEADALSDPDRTEEQKLATSSAFLIRRITQLQVAGETLTKNMYRAEWRSGGVASYDEPLTLDDDRQRLVVALIQKKVADVLKTPRFGASFQMGLLASFESFAETAQIPTDDESGVFDQAGEQTESEEERAGIDRHAIARLARSYEERFNGAPLPHPKMDAVVTNLAERCERGEKSLVFVRRIKSVPELAEKLRRRYDQWLRGYIALRVPGQLGADMEDCFTKYEIQRREARAVDPWAMDAAVNSKGTHEDLGSPETFFSWFFRGDGPKEILSGGAFDKLRLSSSTSPYSILFEDNYVLWLLDDPEDALSALSTYLERDSATVRSELDLLARRRLRRDKAQKSSYANTFEAVQEAAVRLIADASGPLQETARWLVSHVFSSEALDDRPESRAHPNIDGHLGRRTLFTELRRRPELRAKLWPESVEGRLEQRLRDREVRRLLLASTARLGHAYVDLWCAAVTNLGTLKRGERTEADDQVHDLVVQFLDQLDQGSGQPGLTAFRELSEVAAQHDTLLACNFADSYEKKLDELPTLFGRVLSAQTPIGGMWGGVTPRIVQQFRMPGYPLVLVTTDVLKEGEDLHTFCDHVVHYGIAWNPSSMEQRTGRVDRIGSLAHRRLAALAESPQHRERLQVQYPYLDETVEKLQAHRVFSRMDEFMRLTHLGYGAPRGDGRLHTNREFAAGSVPLPKLPEERLHTRFHVKREQWLVGSKPDIEAPRQQQESFRNRFTGLVESLAKRVALVTENTLVLQGAGRDINVAGMINFRGPSSGNRMQPFELRLLSTYRFPDPLLCIESPIGHLSEDRTDELTEQQRSLSIGRLCVLPSRRGQTLLTLKHDLRFHESLTLEHLTQVLLRLCHCADKVEHDLFDGQDLSLDNFRAQAPEPRSHAKNSSPPPAP